MLTPLAGTRSLRVLAAMSAAAALLAAAGCSGGGSAPVATTSSTTSSTPTPTPTPSPTPSKLVGGPVLAVKIDHTTSSYPRVGLSRADVIYVEPVEGGLTRLLAVFSSSMPAKVGPVRSARESDVDLLENYGKVAFAYSGGSAYTLARIRKGPQVNLSNDESSRGFYRDPNRHSPYNVIGVTKELLKRAGGSVKPKDPGFRYFDKPAGGSKAIRVSTSWPSARMTLTWKAKSRGYAIESDGRLEKDALYNNKTVLAQNVVVQYVTTTISGNRDVNGNPTPLEKVEGKGRAMFFRNGTTWRGTWSRPKASSPTTFTTGTGDEMTFAPGPIWVLLVPKGQSVKVS